MDVPSGTSHRTPEGMLTSKQLEHLTKLEAVPIAQRTAKQNRQIVFLKASP